MSKEIIIDGVDVSECKHFDSYYKECKAEYYTRYGYEIVKCDSCKDNSNCYYKQLKRKEQECNKLYIQLKADEEYHKEEENTLRKIIKNKEERNIELYKENNKLKQTLTEIKFWVKEFLKRTGQVVPYEIKEILQKISEVEDDNELY